MNSKYCFILKFSVDDIINTSWNQPFNDQFFVKNYDSLEEWQTIINHNFLNLLESHLPIARLMVFNKPNNWKVKDAHIDPGVLFALNIIIGDSGAEMQWFRPIVLKEKTIEYSVSNTPFLNYQEKELILIHKRCVDNKVSIVKTDIPHRIKIGNSSRTCFSFRFRHSFKTWDEVYTYYKDLDWIKN